MQAMIFAAGLGTRLKPLTDTMPKALVPVAGKPMLEHVINKLKMEGFNHIVINIHHFGEQIITFLESKNYFNTDICISDERDFLRDTGGGIRHAASLFIPEEPILIHNVDILSNANLKELYLHHLNHHNDATLLVSQRNTSRYLLFDSKNHLQGWINKGTGQTKPEGFTYTESVHKAYAFSGIHVISPSVLKLMDENWPDKFSITDFYLSTCSAALYEAYASHHLQLMDIGKPETLSCADEFISHL